MIDTAAAFLYSILSHVITRLLCLQYKKIPSESWQPARFKHQRNRLPAGRRTIPTNRKHQPQLSSTAAFSNKKCNALERIPMYRAGDLPAYRACHAADDPSPMLHLFLVSGRRRCKSPASEISHCFLQDLISPSPASVVSKLKVTQLHLECNAIKKKIPSSHRYLAVDSTYMRLSQSQKVAT